ncbi:hypothetical protein PMSD_04290 [Paenibacillus macquariensis subsp. defensor]|nr:hypothetical protein PMSD_04290 [Paenibacillus macquariensis subsp. defensor]
MGFIKQAPKWGATGIEPPESKRNIGWEVEDRPPAAWLNWFMNLTAESLQELQSKAAEKTYVEDKIAEAIGGVDVDIPDASLTVKGITQLNSAVNSTSETEAATPKAVKSVNDSIATHKAEQATLTTKGHVQLSNATNGTSESKAPTEKALGLVMVEAQAGKQAGNERKAEVVAALVAVGIPATTSETWAQLIPKIAAIIRATGAATATQVLAGAVYSNATGNNRIGTMPNNGTNVNATSVGRWPDDSLAVYIPNGWYGGGMNGGSEAKVTTPQIQGSFPELEPQNIRKDVKVLGVAGTLVEGKRMISERAVYIPSLSTKVIPTSFIPGAVSVSYSMVGLQDFYPQVARSPDGKFRRNGGDYVLISLFDNRVELYNTRDDKGASDTAINLYEF